MLSLFSRRGGVWQTVCFIAKASKKKAGVDGVSMLLHRGHLDETVHVLSPLQVISPR